MQGQLNALVSFIDGFITQGGVDLAEAKKSHVKDGQTEFEYRFFCTPGPLFEAFVYWYTVGNTPHPFICIQIHLCDLDSAKEPELLVQRLLEDNAALALPIRFSLVDGSVCLTARFQVDAVDLEYAKNIIEHVLHHSFSALNAISNQHGVQSTLEAALRTDLH
ncbi:MAG: hypothetical protein AB7F86_01305 [Bdellovibrionales bacterium]